MSPRAIPEGFRTVTPHLVVKGAAQAIDFYKQAFGAEELSRHEMGEAIMDASLRIGDSIVMLNRYAMLRDSHGHSWSIATHIEDVPPEDMQKRAAVAFGGG